MKIRYSLEQMDEQKKQGVDYITALECPEIEQLQKNKVIQLSFMKLAFADIIHEFNDIKICSIQILNSEEFIKSLN